MLNFHLSRMVFERINVTMDLSYIFQDPASSGEIWHNRVWTSRLGIYYAIKHWIQVGAYYQYANRDSNWSEYEFDNNRVALSVKFIH